MTAAPRNIEPARFRIVEPARLRIIEIVVGDTPDAWRAAGFAVGADGCAQVSTVRFRFVGESEGRGILRWAIAGLTSSDVDGLPGEVMDALDYESVAHPNSATLLDHIVLATPDIDRTVGAFVALGCEPKRERSGGSEAMPLRQVFLRAGEVVVEIVGPPTPPERADRRARPATFWGLAFTVADLDACVASLGEACGAARVAVQPGRRIATLRHEALGISVPTVFMS